MSETMIKPMIKPFSQKQIIANRTRGWVKFTGNEFNIKKVYKTPNVTISIKKFIVSV